MLLVSRKRPASLSQGNPSIQKKSKESEEEQTKLIETGMVLKTNNCNYSVGDMIGNGGFGKVFLAKEISSRKEFAMKVLKNETEKQIKRNNAEVSILLKTGRSEFLLGFKSAFVHKDRQLCIVMEKMDIDLFDYVMEHLAQKPMRLALVRKIAKQILLGVSHLHLIGVAHCDLKLENVMIVNRGCTKDPWRIKIIDFGNYFTVDSIRRSTGLKVQNIQYRAPEVLFGLPASEKLDLWSVGILALELYTGFQLIMGTVEWQAICQFCIIFDFPKDVRKGRNFSRYIKEIKYQNDTTYLQVKSFSECEADGIPTGDYEARSIYEHRGLQKIIEHGYNHVYRGCANELDAHFLHLLDLLCAVNETERISAEDALKCQFFN